MYKTKHIDVNERKCTLYKLYYFQYSLFLSIYIKLYYIKFLCFLLMYWFSRPCSPVVLHPLWLLQSSFPSFSQREKTNEDLQIKLFLYIVTESGSLHLPPSAAGGSLSGDNSQGTNLWGEWNITRNHLILLGILLFIYLLDFGCNWFHFYLTLVRT